MRLSVNIQSKIVVPLIAAVLLLAPGMTFAAGYYPKASPSSWYTQPDSWLGFSGSGFAPNEKVTFTGAVSGVVSANANGVVSVPYAVVVPYAWQNSKKTVVLTGNESAYAIPMTIAVGSFYPNVAPSTYYASYGQTQTATATGFAPKETVELRINGVAVRELVANNVGTAIFTFVAPAQGTTYTLTALGLLSGRTSSRIVTLH